MKKYKSILVVMFTVCFLVLPIIYLQAAPSIGAAEPVNSTDSNSGNTLDNPLGKNIDFPAATKRTIEYVIGFVGVLALIAFIYGGVVWMLSGGDSADIKKGKEMMVWAVFGLVVIFSSYAILNFVFEALLGAKK